MRFSQRIGKTPIQETIQLDTMTESYKNRLLNTIDTNLGIGGFYDSRFKIITHEFIEMYANRFGLRINSIPERKDDFIEYINSKINNEEDGVYFCYDFIELLVIYSDSPAVRKQMVDKFNHVFELEKSACRFDSSYKLIPITDEVELNEINIAINNVSQYSSVDKHLQNARDAFANRQKPDYHKTIAESVNAVEALCKIILQDDSATLGKAVKKLNIHPSLEDSISKLYGFASDEGGIRHSHKKGSNNIDEHTARFILVTCHSIVNYLKAENL